MKKTRILALALAILMLCTMLAGCDEGAKTVMKIGGKKISKEIYTAAIAYSDMSIQQTYGFSLADALGEDMGDGTTGADFLKTQAESFLVEAEAIRALADENGVTLAKEDEDAIKDAKTQEIESAGDRKAFIAMLEEDGINEAFYDYMMESIAYYSKVQTELFTGEGKYAPSAENIATTFGDIYRCVKHVLVMAKDGDADFAEKRAKAEDIAKRAKNGEDFDALIAEFGEDPGMESNKGGYLLDDNGGTPTGGSMVAEFSAASAALEVGEVSDIVRTDYGFHIIKRYPMSAEHIATDLEGFTSQVGQTFFSTELSKLIENIEVEHTKAYDSVDLYEILGANKTIGDDVAIEGDSHEGHDHSAEGEEIPEITLTPAE